MSRRGLRFYPTARERYAAALERPLPRAPLWRRLLSGLWRWC